MSNEKIHLNYLEKCLELASAAVKKGNHPFGALIVLDNKIMVTSENEVTSLSDITAHAELLLIQKAQKVMTLKELSKCTLYTSTEPCAMCSGAIYWSGLKEVIYGASNKTLSKVVGGSLEIPCEKIFNSGTNKIKVTSFDHVPSFTEVHVNFWNL